MGSEKTARNLYDGWQTQTRTTMEKREMSLNEAMDMCRNLSYIIHDITSACGHFAATDLTIDQAVIMRNLVNEGKATEYVAYDHCDTYHRMSYYAFRLDLELVGTAIKVGMECLKETDNEDDLYMCAIFANILSEHENGVYKY